MLTTIHPKLPMRDKTATRNYYINQLGFQEFGSADFDGYLMVAKDNIQIHFLNSKNWIPKKTTDRCISEQMPLKNYTRTY